MWSSIRCFFQFSLEASAKLSDFFHPCDLQLNFTLNFLSTSESALRKDYCFCFPLVLFHFLQKFQGLVLFKRQKLHVILFCLICSCKATSWIMVTKSISLNVGSLNMVRCSEGCLHSTAPLLSLENPQELCYDRNY